MWRNYGLSFNGAPTRNPAAASSQQSYGCRWGATATRTHTCQGAPIIVFTAGVFQGCHTEIWLKAMLIKERKMLANIFSDSNFRKHSEMLLIIFPFYFPGCDVECTSAMNNSLIFKFIFKQKWCLVLSMVLPKSKGPWYLSFKHLDKIFK